MTLPSRLRALALELAGPAALLVAALVILAPNTLGGRSLVPFDALLGDPVFAPSLERAGIHYTQNALVADLVFQNLVWKDFLAAALSRGEAPLWNPHLAGGLPFLAAGQHSLFYPLTVPLLALLPPERALGWLAALNLWLAGLGLYFMARVLRLGRAPATFMGLAGTLSLLMVANAVFPMIQSGLAWLPALLAAIHRLTEGDEGERAGRRPPRALATGAPGAADMGWLLLIAAATCLCALAGHPEAFIQSLLVAMVFTAWRVARLGLTQGWPAAWRAGFWVAAAVAVGVLGGMVQLAPLLELARANFRSGAADYSAVPGWAFGTRQAITFLVPDFYGNPAHHAVRLLDGTRLPLADHAMWGGAWGTKNYVEAAAYPGLALFALAPLGLLQRRRRALAVFAAILGLLALSFAFGLPTYRLLFFGVPGFEQLRTPFRWVFAVNLALTLLAGLGLDALIRRPEARLARAAAWWGGALALAGAAGQLALASFRLRPQAWTGLVERFMDLLGCPDGYCARDAALTAFPDMTALAAYQHGNLGHLFLFLTLAGLGLALVARAGRRPALALGTGLLLAGLALDLGTLGFGFNPATDPALAALKPEPVAVLQDLVDAKWGRVSAFGDAKLLWPNSAMRFGLSDLRAYDSILPVWTTQALSQIEDQAGWLLYNRLGNLTQSQSLSHPLARALGLRYVVASGSMAHPQIQEVYQGREDGLRIYENLGAMPRAWVVERATVLPDRAELLAALDDFDPQAEVLLEEAPDPAIWRSLPPGRQVPVTTRILRDRETLGTLEVEVEGAPSGGLLVVSDAWFPGWKATVEVVDAARERREVAVPIYRANGMQRAVPVPPGYSVVRLRYAPLAVKGGVYGSFLGGILALLGLAYAIGRRFLRLDSPDELRRAALNSALPFAASLLGKVIQFGFAMLMLRIITPAEAGRYAVAVTVIGLADILANFGLSVWTTREVAQRPAQERAILGQALVLRVALWALAGLGLAAYLARGLRAEGGAALTTDAAAAIVLLAVALLPSQLSAALASVFQGRERLLVPAAVGLATTLVNVAVGAALLLLGYGIVGVAAASIASNLATLAIFLRLAGPAGIRPSFGWRPAALAAILVACWPLMLNSLLQTLFFKMDILLLRHLLPRDGDTLVGWYQSAYKWIDALLIISPSIVMAIFPLLSRRAAGDPAGLRRAYVLTLRWLLQAALPIALVTSVLAEPLIWLLAGADYLPEGANALKIMVWFLPLSFANGLAQYVLIALGRQRWITLSFLGAAAFNLVANWLVIPGHAFGPLTVPAFTYVGAAAVTILSEAALWLPFSRGLRDLDVPPLLVLLWRPLMATALAAVLILGLQSAGAPLLLAAAAGLAAYGLALHRLGAILPEDRDLARRILRPGS